MQALQAVNFQQLRYNILKLLTVSTDAEIKDTLALVDEYKQKHKSDDRKNQKHQDDEGKPKNL